MINNKNQNAFFCIRNTTIQNVLLFGLSNIVTRFALRYKKSLICENRGNAEDSLVSYKKLLIRNFRFFALFLKFYFNLCFLVIILFLSCCCYCSAVTPFMEDVHFALNHNNLFFYDSIAIIIYGAIST